MKGFRLLAACFLVSAAAPASDSRHSAEAPCSAIRLLPPRDTVTLPSSRAVVRVADVTGDGRPDVLVFDPVASRAHVEVQGPDGRFRPGPALEVSPRAFSVGVADLDGDGREEGVLLRVDGPQQLRVSADGGLDVGPAPAGPGLGPATPTAFVRLDGSGRSSLLAVVADGLVALTLLPSSYFQTTVLLPGSPALLLVPGDFDGDGNQDVFAVGPDDYPRYRELSNVLFGDGRGGMRVGPSLRFPAITSIATGDFDRDGKSDVVFNSLETTPTGIHVVSAQLRGDAARGLVYANPSLSITGSPSDALVASDLDGDGILDLVVSSGESGRVWRGTSSGGFVQTSPLPGAIGSRLEARDVDGDGRSDLLGLEGGRLVVLRNICATSLPDRVVPSIVSVTGVGGRRYETELMLDNAGGDLSLELRYTSSFGGGDGTVLVTLPAGAQRVFSPANASLAALGLPISAGGDHGGTLAVRVLSGTASFLAVRGRVISAVPGGESSAGFGDVPLGSGFSDEVVVGWLRETDGDRGNLALVNVGGPDAGDLTLRPVVVATDSVPSRTIPLPEIHLGPGEVLQLNRVLHVVGVTSGFARVERVSGTAPFFAYGVVNDEGSGDGSVVRGFEPSRRPSSRFTIPAVVESSRYTSDLVVTNATSESRHISFHFGSATPFDFALEVPPNGQVFIPDLVDALRQQDTSGVGPPGATYVGALFVEVAGPPVSGVFLGVRVSARRAEGRYGVFYEAVPDGDLASFRCWIPAVRQDATVRTNVAIVNAGDVTGTFVVTATDPLRGREVGSAKTVVLEPGGWTQIDSALFALGTGLEVGRLTITRTSTNAPPFLAYGVTNDGARPGEGTDDPSYLPMTRFP